MTIHTFPGEAPARRVLSGSTASEEQRRAACETIESRKLTDEEVAVMMSGQYGYKLPPAHNCELLADMNAKRAQSEPVPLAGVLLIMSAFGFFGAALAVWWLV